MKDIWVESEWQDLCDRLMRTARNRQHADCQGEAEQFAKQEPPQRYPQLLDRVREASRPAVSWQGNQQRLSAAEIDDAVTEAGEESFPACDPPA